MKTTELARLIGKNPSTVRRLVAAGYKIPGLLPKTKGGHFRFRNCPELRAWIDRHRDGWGLRKRGRPKVSRNDGDSDVKRDPPQRYGALDSLLYRAGRLAQDELWNVDGWSTTHLEYWMKLLKPLHHAYVSLSAAAAKSRTTP